jgi:hypothetical protein
MILPNHLQENLMSVFNEYGNLQDEQTKNVRELIDDICKKELIRLQKEGASIIELKAVVRDFIVAVELAGSDVIVYQQHKMNARAFRDKLTAAP